MYAYMHLHNTCICIHASMQVDAERDLPAGELVIGLNPPFGHQNRIAIDFVEHALCAIATSSATVLSLEPQS